MPDIDIPALREAVVDALMTNGWGQRAWRLKLCGKSEADVHVFGARETDLGGRNRASVTDCLQPLMDRIEALEAELSAIQARTCEACYFNRRGKCSELDGDCEVIERCGLWQPKEGK